jgi:hypothetical protein
MSRLIAFLTDYGYADTYVAQVKAVLLRLCPTCEVLDLTHGVPPQNVRSGAYLLASATPYLPDGTIVIAVVDPGVGTARRAVAVQGLRHTYLAPDNGLLCLALRDDLPQKAVVLDNPRYHLPEVSATFHGRDLFAPCAAHLANGVPLEQLGTAIPPDTLQRLPHLEPEFTPDADSLSPVAHRPLRECGVQPCAERHFGQWLGDESAPVRLRLVGVRTARRWNCRWYAPSARSAGASRWRTGGSSGYLEVAVNGGSAARNGSTITDDAVLTLICVFRPARLC